MTKLKEQPVQARRVSRHARPGLYGSQASDFEKNMDAGGYIVAMVAGIGI